METMQLGNLERVAQIQYCYNRRRAANECIQTERKRELLEQYRDRLQSWKFWEHNFKSENMVLRQKARAMMRIEEQKIAILERQLRRHGICELCFKNDVLNNQSFCDNCLAVAEKMVALNLEIAA